jgi:hypothetical protein
LSEKVNRDSGTRSSPLGWEVGFTTTAGMSVIYHPGVSANQAAVWFSLAALVVATLWLFGFVNTILVVVGFAVIATLSIRHVRAGRVARPTVRSVVFHIFGILAVGAHLALGIGYLLFAVVGARQASDSDRALLAVVTALVWLAIFGLGLALWLKRQWLIVAVPVLTVAAPFMLRAYADALPAVPAPEPHSPAGRRDRRTRVLRAGQPYGQADARVR